MNSPPKQLKKALSGLFNVLYKLRVRFTRKLNNYPLVVRYKGQLPACLIALVLSCLLSTAAAQQNLPSMGEPADLALSPAEEQQLGAQFMRQIRTRLPLVQDVQITEYIENLGNRLVRATGRTDLNNFTFFIIDNPQINAFAIPGGYVGINSGLIDAMVYEEQLASVVAHEIAHVTQRHHARSFATVNRTSLSAAAAILAAIIIGQASPQAGSAALAAGLAVTQQTAINFTRSNEVEADRIGIEILANANFDARAMAETFDILRRKNSLNTSGNVLEYLRTHPLDNNRIAEATDRASTKRLIERPESLDFDLFKARLSVLTSRDRTQTMRVFKSSFERNGNLSSAYAMALLAVESRKDDDAKKYLNALDAEITANTFVELLRADISSDTDRSTRDSRLAALSDLYPERYSIVEKRLESLISIRQYPEALSIVNRYIRNNDTPATTAWRQLANIQQLMGDSAGSHESLARYFEELDELQRAKGQLELALRAVPSGSQDEIRLTASLKNLTERATRLR